jgi:hypothetical protein
MRGAAILALVLSHPAPVTTIGGKVNPDGSVTISWTLPADPGVVGVTVFRDDLDGGDDVEFTIVGLTNSFTDTGARSDHDLRYWVHTRDASGDLSDGAFVEVLTDDDDGDWFLECHGSASPRASPLLALLALAAAAAAIALRR